jgi:histidine triad (HIT) family protein
MQMLQIDSHHLNVIRMTFALYLMDCIFCRIVKKEVPSEIVYEDGLVFAFNDIHPNAPVHILVIPKKHIGSLNELADDDEILAGRIIMVAKKLAKEKGIDEGGYKLLFRVGRHGGQEVPHIHLHLIGGAPLSENIRPIK